MALAPRVFPWPPPCLCLCLMTGSSCSHVDPGPRPWGPRKRDGLTRNQVRDEQDCLIKHEISSVSGSFLQALVTE